MIRDIMHSTISGSKRRGSFPGFAVLVALTGGIAGLMAMPGQAMAGDQGGIKLTPAQRAQLGNAQAADLPYVKAPVPVMRVYSWTGFYGGAFGGGAVGSNRDYSISADPLAVNTVVVGPAANGAYPIYSQAYNNLANGPFVIGAGPAPANVVQSATFSGGGQIPNAFAAGGVNFCNTAGGGPFCPPTAAAASSTSFLNTGTRTDSTLPTSMQSASQVAALFGFEVGARKQFDNNFVLGIGADIMAFTHGGTSNYNSSGSFANSNGFTFNAAASACTEVLALGVCGIAVTDSTPGNVQTTNTGASTSTLRIAANPNWIGTVRGSVGYAFDRVLIFGSAGLAYADGPMKVSGSYNDRMTSSCQGTASAFSGGGGGGTGVGIASAFSSYYCNGGVFSSVSQLTTTSVTYSGNRGGTLTGFAAGAGAAYAISDHVSLTLEGMYYNLGTERVTVTGTGTQTTTITTTQSTALGGATTVAGPATAVATATPFTVSKMIDGAVFKGGVQFKF